MELLRIDFHKAMSSNALYKREFVDKMSSWKQIKQRYDKFVNDNFQFFEAPRIPKIIHQIWLGSPFPEKYKKIQETWIVNHPDWEYKLWQDEDIDNLGLENIDLYDAALNYGMKSDIARYEILYRIGGLYVDTDFECLKPFDVFHHNCDFYAGLCTGAEVTFVNALIGCSPGHPIMRECVKRLHVKKENKKGFRETLLQTGPFFFTECFLAVAGKEGTVDIAFPSNYFYPWPWTHRDQNSSEEIQGWVRDETFAIHHWFVSWNHGQVG